MPVPVVLVAIIVDELYPIPRQRAACVAIIHQHMAQLPTSGIRLFKLFGIQVFLHWTWFVVALYEIESRKNDYSSPVWNIAEYLALFAIVLMHEFGHALACRSVGGTADRILLWPLGGVAFVSPPPRPGALLWSIIAGPLVNVILLPITFGLLFATQQNNLPPDVHQLFSVIAVINLVLLLFNILPIYPLDGGQIVRAILWFFIGQNQSLMVASVIGLVGSVLGLALALWFQSYWLVIMAGFAALQSWGAFQRSRSIRNQETIPRHQEAQCPVCGAHPPMVPIWKCSCGATFDTFKTRAICPACGRLSTATTCPSCRKVSPIAAWYPHIPAAIPQPQP
jgi:Zn-dependent protease